MTTETIFTARLMPLLFCAVLAFPFHAVAQQQSEIEVNTTVLLNVPGQARGHEQLKPIVLKPPPGMIDQSAPPSETEQPVSQDDATPGFLTAPADSAQITPSGNLTPSGRPVIARQVRLGRSPRPTSIGIGPRVERRILEPAPVRVKPPVRMTVTPYIPEKKHIRRAYRRDKTDDHIVQFPVMVTRRSESSDPSLVETPSLPPPPPIKPPQPVLPVNADVVAAIANQLSPPPAPVAKPGHRARPQVRINAVKVKSASHRVMATRLDAPALPKANNAEAVTGAPIPGAGPLPPPRVTDDHTMNKMMNMDKARVMAGIVDTVRRVNNLPGRHGPPEGVPDVTGTVNATPLMGAAAGGNVVITPDKTPARANLPDVTESPATGDKTASMDKSPPAPGGPLSLTYDQKQMGLTPAQQAELNASLLPLMKKDPSARLKINAYASDTGKNDNARQRSLARALAAREYLIAHGIGEDRLDIHALGMQTEREPLDRIDFVVVSPGQSKTL